jgi:uncharacterized protein YdbL (DUF1318 family)
MANKPASRIPPYLNPANAKWTKSAVQQLAQRQHAPSKAAKAAARRLRSRAASGMF